MSSSNHPISRLGENYLNTIDGKQDRYQYKISSILPFFIYLYIPLVSISKYNVTIKFEQIKLKIEVNERT